MNNFNKGQKVTKLVSFISNTQVLYFPVTVFYILSVRFLNYLQFMVKRHVLCIRNCGIITLEEFFCRLNFPVFGFNNKQHLSDFMIWMRWANQEKTQYLRFDNSPDQFSTVNTSSSNFKKTYTCCTLTFFVQISIFAFLRFLRFL